ncbi:glycosyltransferase family 2 protein [Pedobacter sp. L105]|uniref:glycosyltransferase family 2 protein n=1 Tax=Pedobacter sp. L105 TaxID=1641871 RepID=UPI00131C99AF|nr:glycosyltransferase family 2 protein [Pedobacter sp. L105]
MKISVVMTTYNGEKYLEQQLDSILSQTLLPAELIVCDDCSTDGTVLILKKYQQKGLLTYVVNDHQLGLIDNFKNAVSLTTEMNYVALSDQDDLWLPDKLERSAELLKTLDQQLPAMVYTDLLLVDENDKVLNPSFRNELGQDKYRHNLQTLLFGNFVNGCTMLMNPALKQYFREIPNDVRLNHDGWIALAAFTFGEAKEIPLPLVRYRKHESNVSIAADTKPRNRYRSTLNEVITAVKGNDDFLSAQFETVRRFYERFSEAMTPFKRAYFEQFLQLEQRHYLIKKLAYRSIVKKFPRN